MKEFQIWRRNNYMIKSFLATEIYEAHENNYNKGREDKKVCKITPHIMAGILSAEQ